jgi:hypothetical protein
MTAPPSPPYRYQPRSAHVRLPRLPTALLLVSVLSAPALSAASEGMMAGAVYACDARAVNEEMVTACSRAFPTSSADASNALASWLERNAAKAESAKQTCADELDAIPATDGENERLRESIARIRADIRTDFQERIEREGQAACSDALRQLKTAHGPLDL